jgi:roadblock/LC7 domain-containing protein
MARTVQGNQDLWLLDGARASRFTFDPGLDSFPVWSPDGTRIVYRARGISGGLDQKLTNGAGAEEQFLSTDQTVAPTSWSEDGRFLMYVSIDPTTNGDLWVLPMSGNAGERKPFVFLKTPFREAYGAFSPDGRWVAYHSNESGRNEIYVRPFVPGATATAAAAAGGQWQISTGGGIHPLWRSDGKELYYLNPDGAMMAVPITVNGATLEPGAPIVLFPTRIYGGGADIQLGRQYDVAPRWAFPHQHVVERSCRADHAAPELASRREEIDVAHNRRPGADATAGLLLRAADLPFGTDRSVSSGGRFRSIVELLQHEHATQQRRVSDHRHARQVGASGAAALEDFADGCRDFALVRAFQHRLRGGLRVIAR